MANYIWDSKHLKLIYDFLHPLEYVFCHYSTGKFLRLPEMKTIGENLYLFGNIMGRNFYEGSSGAA